MKKIYIIHEYGAPNHFIGLTYLLREKGWGYSFYELNYLAKIRHGIKHFELSLIIRGIINWFFIKTIKFRRPGKIILAIAPYNKVLVSLRKKLDKHQVYYFTSYTVWDQSTCVHDYHNDECLLITWKEFLWKDTTHIFAVSEKAKDEIVRNGFATADKVSVVNHSYTTNIETLPNTKKKNIFIAVGGLAKHKGTEELLDFFSRRPDLKLILVGKGDLKEKVLSYCDRYPNITYKGYIDDQEELFKTYKEASFFILNSHRTPIWEELFGMVLIESSACGLIPVATNHSGPMEIIQDGINGFICIEGHIDEGIRRCLLLDDENFERMRRAAIENGQQYHMSCIAHKWKKILN